MLSTEETSSSTFSTAKNDFKRADKLLQKLARRSREVQSLYKMYEEEEKSDKKEVLERLVGENLKVQEAIRNELKNGLNVSPAKSGISFEGISQLRTYSGEETSQNLSLFGEKFILAKNIPMESEPDTYSLNQKATELYTDSEMSDGGRETPV